MPLPENPKPGAAQDTHPRPATRQVNRQYFFSAFLSRLASFFSFGVLVGAFLTFFFASWLLPMACSPLLNVIVAHRRSEVGGNWRRPEIPREWSGHRVNYRLQTTANAIDDAW